MLTTVLILAVGMVQQNWHTFAPAGKNFRVELPSPPTSMSNRPVTNSAGGSQLTAAYLKGADATYSIQVTESRDRVDPTTLDEGIRQFAADKQGTLGTLKPITVNGNPGRDFEMTEPSSDGPVRSKRRWVVSGSSLFMLMAAGKPGGEVSGDADRFLGSLAIVGVKVAGGTPAKKVGGAARAQEPVKEDDAGGAMTKGDDTGEVTVDANDAGEAKSTPARTPGQGHSSKVGPGASHD